MAGDITKEQVLLWRDIMYNTDNEIISQIDSNWKKFKKIFIDKVAGYLYEDMRRSRILITAPFTVNKDFSQLSPDEQQKWHDYAAGIPVKFKVLNLYIRPFSEYCRTCIITDEEIEKFASIDHERYFLESVAAASVNKNLHEIPKTSGPGKVTYNEMPGARKWYFRELNYLIPPQLKKIGFEIIRPEEISAIDSVTIKKLARAIHSRYMQEIRKNSLIDDSFPESSSHIYPGDEGFKYDADYENLPEDIKVSNKDNAYHIPTKLLSTGYKMRPVKKGYKTLTLHLNDEETETMAMVEHIRWSWDKRLNGWIYGNVKDNHSKIHPGLIPYEELAELEKEKDRELVRLIPALLHDIEYEAYHINQDQIKNLSYSIKPHSSIQKLLDETRKLNDEIKEMTASVPEINEKIELINSKIKETIGEVQGSYNYARYIQKTFLPDNLFVRECFPDSFVLYKPKDIVGGDFYFFSHIENKVVFAAADCTGHGIPGALLSTIGYGITDQAVNELNITKPSAILQHLYSRVHRFLRWDKDETGLSDDMDIVMCKLDLRSNFLTYSSVRIPFYRVSNGKILEYFPKNYATHDLESGTPEFLSGTVKLKHGDTIYLCSDGLTDQFGGPRHKKYKRARLKSFLLGIQELTMTEQSDRLYEEIEKWREANEEDQTDDIMVIGIRV